MADQLDPEKQPALVRVDLYEEWRKREGAPLLGGVYIKDMKAVEVGPWPRKGDGVKGALCYLDGDDEGDEHIVELPGGGNSAPLRHMYTEAIYVVSGHGSTSVWRDPSAKQTFEWGPGKKFVVCKTTILKEDGSVDYERYYTLFGVEQEKLTAFNFVYDGTTDFEPQTIDGQRISGIRVFKRPDGELRVNSYIELTDPNTLHWRVWNDTDGADKPMMNADWKRVAE